MTQSQSDSQTGAAESLPKDVRAYLESVVADWRFGGSRHVVRAKELLARYTPKPRWQTGDVVLMNSDRPNPCTVMRTASGAWHCSMAGSSTDEDHSPVLDAYIETNLARGRARVVIQGGQVKQPVPPITESVS